MVNAQSAELAIRGGLPAIPEGPPPWPLGDDAVRDALEAAFNDGSWGRYQGPHGERLATTLAQMCGVEHVLLCSSGTIAVELALRGMKIGPGDEVVLAGYDFGGNFRSIEAVGARPVLSDINPNTWCLDAERLEGAISPQTRAVIVSHLHGGMADMESICELAQRRGLRVLEDACQSPCAAIGGRTAGAWGDVGVLSFGGSKLLTAGRGGAVLTRHADVCQRIKVYCERGNNAVPLSELQSAVLLPQLGQLLKRNATRRESVRLLHAACCHLLALRPLANPPKGCAPSFYKLAWLYDRAHCNGHSRDTFLAAVRAEGVALDAGFRGFTRRPESVCRRAGDLQHSQRAASDTVVLHHPVLLAESRVVARVAEALLKVSRGLKCE